MNRRLILLGTAGAVALAGCAEKRAILTDPFEATAYGYQMANSATNLPRGTVRFKYHATPAAVTAESLTVTLAGLDSLSTSYYTAWAGDSLGTTFKRITGVLTGQRVDTSLTSIGLLRPDTFNLALGTASAIQNGNSRTIWTWKFERAAAGLAATDSMVVFLISIEATNTATTPNATRRPLFARRSEGGPSAGVSTAPIRFGNYAGNPVNQYLYSSSSSRGRGAVWGNILFARDSTLAVPPLGYYYATFALKFVPPGATTGDTLFLGDLTSPWPNDAISLYNADSVNTDPSNVIMSLPTFPQNREIIAGAARISADTLTSRLPSAPCSTNAAGDNRPCPYKGYTDVWLTLQSKDAVRGRMSPNRVLGGAVPYLITTGQYK